jgi:hypothetical protein
VVFINCGEDLLWVATQLLDVGAPIDVMEKVNLSAILGVVSKITLETIKVTY